MENIKISCEINKTIKRTILGIALGSIALILIFFICMKNSKCLWIYCSYDRWPHTYSECGTYIFDGCWEAPYIYLIFSFALISLLSFLYFWMISKMQITVTDKRVYGKTYFGRSIDLPLDSVSAVGSSMFNGIAVATSSGKIKFVFIENSKAVHEEIRKLLMNRQEQKNTNTPATPISNVDEIKKYKELFDSGVITEEEFNQKKKQLLGL